MGYAPRRIIRLHIVEERTGLKKSAIYDSISRGSFPRPIPLTGKAVGWIEAEVENWIGSRIAQREAA